MANPLVNELIIGTGSKDRWNATDPATEAQFLIRCGIFWADQGAVSLWKPNYEKGFDHRRPRRHA
jgi:hypothetical protein